MRYATALTRDPAATYRQVGLVGRTSTGDPHALVSMLYEEGMSALRSAAWAAERRRFEMKSERVARATAVLFALEAGLDFDAGGEVSRALEAFYHDLRQRIVQASLGTDPRPFHDAADSLAEIADAWRSVRGA
ncbi:flagellar export chaperone FliS [Sphingomonas sp.]|uniref:flagellar export chaperone FliS n=1 Tax=Sphingomonas sp. TaxID=28214 RepID=UPI001AFEE67D|nr:flagellar export chaperone FliS [Sphingomonas sp.]MBO9713942.1 flagellar export chaperone FliS [Sphingomonas sp.]